MSQLEFKTSAARFFSWLYSLPSLDSPFPGLIEIRVRFPASGEIKRTWIRTPGEYIIWTTSSYRMFSPSGDFGAPDVYYGVCCHSGRDGTKATVTHIPALWLDIDVLPTLTMDTIFKVMGIPDPSLVLSSGRGWHCYWRFRDPLPVGENRFLFEMLMKALAVRTGADVAATDLSRILRVPGTVNQKNGKTVLVLNRTAEVFTLDQLAAAILRPD